ncbi:MAG: hypothetical protein ACYS47_07900 [Planctomycetota bacterium]
MFIESNTELVELLKNFVAMKFGETDQGKEFFVAAGALLPQWFWHPVLAVCRPDGREINPKWRHTHESFSAKTVVDIMKQALAATGGGIDAKLARKMRGLLTEAEDALILQEYDKAMRLAGQVRKAVNRGRLVEDATRIEKEAAFLAEAKKRLDSLSPRAEASEPFIALLDALNYCLVRDYPEALNIFEQLGEGSGEYAKMAAALRPRAKAILESVLEIIHVSLGRYRFGPDIYHDIQSHVRCRLEGLAEIVLQYAVLLDDGTVYAAFEGHGEVEVGNNHRSSTFLPYVEIPSSDRIADLRVELWLGDRLVDAEHLRPEASTESWWEKETVQSLLLDNGSPSRWSSKDFPKTKRTGVRYKGPMKLISPEVEPDPVRQEIVEIFKILDWKRFTLDSRIASYRLSALGRKAAPHLAPLAYRYGAITTLQVLYPIARIPHADSARAIIHNLGADDVTLIGPARRLVGWLEGQSFVPLDELLGYLKSDSHALKQWGAHTLGIVGRKEGFRPLVSFLRSTDPGSKTAGVAVSALRNLTGIDFGLDSDLPLAEQATAVKRLLAWWDDFAEEAPRTHWMARALEEMKFAPKGTLVKACETGDRKTLERAVRKALEGREALGRRAALLLAKDLGLRAVGPVVFERFRTMGSRHRELGLTRNVLRALMTPDLLEGLIGQLNSTGNGSLSLELLITLTRQYELYPRSGRRMGAAGWKKERERWSDWLVENREKLQWNAEEGWFEVGE